MSFDKWYREVGYLGDDQNTRVKIAYEAGQQSKQAEIDELQKRIDEAVELMTVLNDDNTVRFMKKPMLKILKGNTDDH